MDQDVQMRRIIDNLSSDLNNLSSETKRKFGTVKEASESSLLKLRQINNLKSNLYKTMCDSSAEVIKPLILGCETKQPKIIQICLASVQKVIEAKILNLSSASMLVNTLWHLTDNGLEELKVLQTIILLVTTTDVVKHLLLAKTLTIGLRIAASKDSIVMNTANAMLSQMVTKVFERVSLENKSSSSSSSTNNQIDIDKLKSLNKDPPEWMTDCAQDGYMLLQDIYLLLNSDQSLWLININDINRPFGLELLKSVLVRYPEIFYSNPEMSFILKERICPLLIKLFSPSTKIKLNSSQSGQNTQLSPNSSQSSTNGSALTASNDPKNFGIVSRLIRIVFVLIKNYFELLITETEIFLSLLVKFLEYDRPLWQKALAIEVFHKISIETNLIESLVVNYDMKQHPEKIFMIMTNGIALFIHSLFANPSNSNSNPNTLLQTNQNNSLSNLNQNNQSQNSPFAFQISSAQPSFSYKDWTIQLLFPYISGQVKSMYLDGWDKLDIPFIQDGYLLSIGFATIQEFCKSIQALIEKNLLIYQQLNNSLDNENNPENLSKSSISLIPIKLDQEEISKIESLNKCIHIMNSSSNSFLFVYNILLESSLDESITEQIIKSIKAFIYMTSLLNMNSQRDAFVTSLCKAALPANYAQNVLNLKSITDLNFIVNVNTTTTTTNSKPKTLQSDNETVDRQIQVVAIGPALTGPSGFSNSANQSSSSSNTLYITAKNLLTMKSILNMTHIYSELIGSSWYIILSTMQHLTWTLGLKPVQGSNGQLKNTNSSLLSANSSTTSPTSTSQTTSSQSTTEPNISTNSGNQSSMITTAIQTEIAFICNMLSKLFESTRNLSDQALKDIIDALLQLSIECSDLAYLRNEPCLFAMAKLFETSVSNLNRIESYWPQVTMHMLVACKHTNLKYREWSVEIICNMIRSAFNYVYTNNPASNINDVRESILRPLNELSTIHFNDVRQKQIECTLSILRLMGQHLKDSWPVCLNIIGEIYKEHTESLIRSAFQCLQLIVTDFLSMIKAKYLSLVINVVAKFGSQEQDLNISLTAIVLLWNISDYMFQNSEKLNDEFKSMVGDEESLNKDFIKLNDSTYKVDINSIEAVWMVLYSRLGQLCIDQRPAVRKSACQTLFCTISSHGSILNVDLHWKDLVWNVLFPLLEMVQLNTSTASRERDKHANHPNFLMHHSRDTAEKQWAETSVLTLAGVTKVFSSKSLILMKLEDKEFQKMWLFLLNIIKILALSQNSEISQSALRGFHELLGNQNYFSSSSSYSTGMSNSAAQTVAAAAAAASIVTTTNSLTTNQNSSANKKPNDLSQNNQSNNNQDSSTKSLDLSQWLSAWKTWIDIGNSLNSSTIDKKPPVDSPNEKVIWPPPSQTFLTCYVDLVSVIVEKLAPHSNFFSQDFEDFSIIIDKLLSIPVLNGDYSSFVLIQVESNLTPLQNSCLNTIRNLIKLFKVTDTSFQNTFISLIFKRLLSFVLYACYNSNQVGHNGIFNGLHENKIMSSGNKNDVVSVSFVHFGEKSLTIMTNLYEETANNEAVIENSILKEIIQTLYVPLSLKYSCPSPTTWKLSIESLFKILKKALPIIYKNRVPFESMWIELARTFEDFLFTKNIAQTELPIEIIQKDEMIDCQVIEIIRDELLTHANLLPQQFIQKILAILNKGSIYSNTFENFLDMDTSRKLREEFSKTCFETLLKYSFVKTNELNINMPTNNEVDKEEILTRMALSSMLNRCKEIIQRYIHDERLNGNIPLSRARTNEMISVLKALSTLINALKKAPKESIQSSIWNQVISLYPCLVECTASPTSQISSLVKDTLHQYFSLLKAP